MNAQGLALTLRPRTLAEAADLGLRLVQANAATVWRIYTPVWLVVVVLSFSLIGVADWLPGLLIFWLKPWLDRSLLFVFSRAAFAEPTRWADLWRAQRRVWWSQGAHTLLWQRLSPWRSYTQPIAQLEGASGAELHTRSGQILQGRRSAAAWIQISYVHAEWLLSIGLVVALAQVLPDAFKRAHTLVELAEGVRQLGLLTSLCYPLVVLLLEPYFVAAGFAAYLNRRVELEAWDVEQEFRRAYAA
jgi:hypothetical protein